MSEQKKKITKRSKTKIIPPKKKKEKVLSKDEERYLNKKKVVRKRLARKILKGLVFAVLCFVVLILLPLTIFFKIDTIQIKGAKLYADEVVIKESDIQIGDSLFSVSEKDLNETLPAKLPYIKSVKVDRDLSGVLVLEVFATRETVAFPTEKGYIFADETGKVITDKGEMLREGVAVVKGASLGKITLGQQIKFKNENNVTDFLTLLDGVKKSEIKDITEIIINKNGEYTLVYQDRIKIKIGTVENITDKLQRGDIALKKENEQNPYAEGVLDLSVEPKVFFTPGEEKEITIADGFLSDRRDHLVTDEFGEIVTVSSTSESETATQENDEN